MNAPFLASTAMTLLSLTGYAIGSVEPYPGREASLVGLLIGVTLATVTYGRARSTAGSDGERGDGGRSSRGQSNGRRPNGGGEPR